MNYAASLNGFHNPYKHKGMTPHQFLQEYIKSQKKQFRKGDGWRRVRLVEWIEANYDSQLKYVYRLFPETLVKDTNEPSD